LSGRSRRERTGSGDRRDATARRKRPVRAMPRTPGRRRSRGRAPGDRDAVSVGDYHLPSL
jgi:hypothetical protein